MPSEADLKNGSIPATLPGIGYVGLNDSPGAAQQIKWNGFAESPASVVNGQYTFWGYEHLYTTGTDGDANNFASAFPAKFQAEVDGAGEVANACDTSAYATYVGTLGLDTMNCHRLDDGGHVYTGNH